ncbi:hypothetical protein BH10PLA2_BH10PLA2_24630 [soil metagenome]
MPVRLQDNLRKLTQAEFIVNEQDCFAPSRHLCQVLANTGKNWIFIRLRKVGSERCTQSDLAIDLDESSALLDDSEHRGQAQSGALANFFGCKEGFEHMCFGGLAHARSSVADRQ